MPMHLYIFMGIHNYMEDYIMISPNFDNVTNCKLYNQDTGELVAVGKLTDVSPAFEKVQEENLKVEPVMTFEESFSFTWIIRRV